MDNELIETEITEQEIATKMLGFENAYNNGELEHLFPAKSFKEKYQNKLQKLLTEILNDNTCSTVADGQQQYVIQAVHYLIEVDKTNELMRVLVKNFKHDLIYM